MLKVAIQERRQGHGSDVLVLGCSLSCAVDPGGCNGDAGEHLVCRRCCGSADICLCGGALWLQIVLFFVVSVALLLLLRPLLRRQCNPDKLKTNVDALIGKQAIVIEKIDNLEGRGRIQVDSADWTARSDDGSVIDAGCLVEIHRIEGVRAYVAPVHAAVGAR